MMEEFHKSGEHHTGWWERFRAWAFKFLRSSARYWWIPFFTTAAGLAFASWVIFQQHVVYISSGRMMVSGRINLQQGAVFSEELANFFGTQTELMKSSEVRMKAVNLLASTDPRLEPVPTDLAVSQLPQTSIFVLSTTGPDAQYVQKFLDAIMTEYIATKKEMRSSKTEDTQAAIVGEIARVEHEMQQSEQDLLNFQKANNVGYLEQEGNSAGVYLANLNRQLADLKTQYQLFSTMDLDEIIAKTQNDPGHAGNLAARSADVEYQGLLGTGIQPEDQYLEARQQLAVLKSQRDALAKTFRPKHPKMVDIADKISQQELLIATLRQQSLDRFKTMRDSIKGQIDNLTKAIGEWDKKALSLSERLADYNQLKANFERTKSLYDRLVNNLHDVDITRNVDQDLISILEKASPAQPIKPGFERVLTVGICVGLLVGLSAIFFLDYIDDRFSSPADVQSRLDEHLLGHVPSLKQKGTLAPLR
ncbi:MAG: hypothetical protein JO151_20690, partial [Verrucomicrobia bacterium]|nr:hypothetical protein [Verrucomicrobiota bacterium]